MRRSAPHPGWERLAHLLFPVHFFKCRDCGHRDRRLGDLGRDLPPSGEMEHRGRPLEKRDVRALQLRKRRQLATVAIATALGTALGMLLGG